MAGSKKFSPLLVLLLATIAAVLVLGSPECRDCKKEARINYKELRSECRGNFTVWADRKACDLREKSAYFFELSNCWDTKNGTVTADCA